MLHVIMISLLLRLRGFALASLAPAIDTVINVVEIFVAKLIDTAETDFLK